MLKIHCQCLELLLKCTQAIILVGGLGASEYVYKRLVSEFKSMEVMQPINAYVN